MEEYIIDLNLIKHPQIFQEMCKDLLAAMYRDFEPVGAPDRGLDGLSHGWVVGYQFYAPKQTPRKDKIKEDVQKIKKYWGTQLDKLIWITNFEFTAKNRQWVEEENTPFKLEYWGPTRLLECLSKYPRIIDKYFPKRKTETIDAVFMIGEQKGETVQNISIQRATFKTRASKIIQTKRAKSSEALTPDQEREITDTIERIADAKGLSGPLKRKFFNKELGKLKKIYKARDWRDINRDYFPEIKEHYRKHLWGVRGEQSEGQERKGFLRTIHAKRGELGWNEDELHEKLLRRFGKKRLSQYTNNELRLVINWLNEQLEQW